MAEDTQVQPRTKVLSNGAIYDLDKGRIVATQPGGVTTKFTPETSVKALERKRELKRQAVLRGAARALEVTGDWTAPDDTDVVEAISEAVTLKALNPDNAKQVDAARFILSESGMSESQTQSNAEVQQLPAIEALSAAIRILAEALAPRDVIEVTATDIRNELEAGNSATVEK